MNLSEVVARHALTVLCDTGRWVQLDGVNTPNAFGDCWKADGYVVVAAPVPGVVWLQRGAKPKEVTSE
jgi:hypothetical protein